MKIIPVLSEHCRVDKCVNCPGYVLVDGEKQPCEHLICRCNLSLKKQGINGEKEPE